MKKRLRLTINISLTIPKHCGDKRPADEEAIETQLSVFFANTEV